MCLNHYDRCQGAQDAPPSGSCPPAPPRLACERKRLAVEPSGWSQPPGAMRIYTRRTYVERYDVPNPYLPSAHVCMRPCVVQW